MLAHDRWWDGRTSVSASACRGEQMGEPRVPAHRWVGGLFSAHKHKVRGRFVLRTQAQGGWAVCSPHTNTRCVGGLFSAHKHTVGGRFVLRTQAQGGWAVCSPHTNTRWVGGLFSAHKHKVGGRFVLRTQAQGAWAVCSPHTNTRCLCIPCSVSRGHACPDGGGMKRPSASTWVGGWGCACASTLPPAVSTHR